MFAKCIRQHFVISILPPDLLICLEGKTLTDQHIESAFYPHRSANQHFTPALKLAVFGRELTDSKLNKSDSRVKYPSPVFLSLDSTGQTSACLWEVFWQITHSDQSIACFNLSMVEHPMMVHCLSNAPSTAECSRQIGVLGRTNRPFNQSLPNRRN